MVTIRELTNEHYEYLMEELGVSKDRLFELIDANNDELDELITNLALREIDDIRAQDLVDAICDEFE